MVMVKAETMVTKVSEDMDEMKPYWGLSTFSRL